MHSSFYGKAKNQLPLVNNGKFGLVNSKITLNMLILNTALAYYLEHKVKTDFTNKE